MEPFQQFFFQHYKEYFNGPKHCYNAILKHFWKKSDPSYAIEFIFGMTFLRDRDLTVKFTEIDGHHFINAYLLSQGHKEDEKTEFSGQVFALISLILMVLFAIYLIRLKRKRERQEKQVADMFVKKAT